MLLAVVAARLTFFFAELAYFCASFAACVASDFTLFASCFNWDPTDGPAFAGAKSAGAPSAATNTKAPTLRRLE